MRLIYLTHNEKCKSYLLHAKTFSKDPIFHIMLFFSIGKEAEIEGAMTVKQLYEEVQIWEEYPVQNFSIRILGPNSILLPLERSDKSIQEVASEPGKLEIFLAFQIINNNILLCRTIANKNTRKRSIFWFSYKGANQNQAYWVETENCDL